MSSFGPCCSHMNHINIPEYTEHFRGCTDLRNKCTTKRRVNDTTYIQIIIPCMWAVIMINVGLAQPHPNNLGNCNFLV